MDLTTAINALGSDYVSKVQDAMTQSVGTTDTNGDSTFDSIFNSVSGLLESTNSYIQQAQQAEIDFALGKMTNTHELGVYQQQANIALQYTVAIRDKALEAYREIMNMSI
ncbi:MAG: flagellar hook-basal body complex protein FliE [Eubacteriales bacterium]|nr:flagellar hook-basal body complex protein FliE [Eubacteriales bacterium]